MKILFAEPKNELSTSSSISFSHYESQKNKIFENVLEFRQEVCHWNVLIVLGCWSITLLQSSFPINLNSFYVIEEALTKTSKLSTVSRPISSLKCFPGIFLNQRIYFAVLMLKSSFNFLGATMKSQKWSKSEALGSNYTFKDGLAEYFTVCPNKCILKSFKFLANKLHIHFTWTHCICMYILMYICR